MLTVYVGGFVYDELSPSAFVVLMMVVSSLPLLLKFKFWKKVLFLIPLLIFRVIGKYLLMIFGKNALSFLVTRSRKIERYYVLGFRSAISVKNAALKRWGRLRRTSQCYLLLIFMPLALVIGLFVVVVKLFRLKFLQLIIEKIMLTGLNKVPHQYVKNADNRFAKIHKFKQSQD